MPVPVQLNGNAIILRGSFTKANGATPTTMEMEMYGKCVVPLDGVQVFRIGNSTWQGYTVDSQWSKREGSGWTTRVRAVDTRDDLFNAVVFGQINMIDENTGNVYCIVDDSADSWSTQTASSLKYYYPRMLIEDLLGIVDFSASYSSGAAAILASVSNSNWQSSRYNVFNLDWNTGIKIGAALTQICELLGIQFTVDRYNPYRLYFTKIGELDSGIEWEGIYATESTSGSAVQGDVDTGVYIVGDRDVIELQNFPLVPAWNQAWNIYYLDNNYMVELENYLLGMGMSIYSSTVGEVAEVYQPYNGYMAETNFVDGKKFNDMIVSEYLESVPFKVYRCSAIESFLTEDEYNGVIPVRNPPICTPLLTDPGMQYRIQATFTDRKSKKFSLNAASCGLQHRERGHRLVETTGHVIFDEPQYQVTLDGQTYADSHNGWLRPEHYIPDAPLLDCVVYGSMFRQFYGTSKRVGVKRVPGLRMAYTLANGGELAEYTPEGEKNPMYVAEDVATSLLARPRIITSGEETFTGISGHEPGGQIQRVTVNLDENGITERVTYANDEPSLEYDPQVELRRKIAADQALKAADKIRGARKRQETQAQFMKAVASDRDVMSAMALRCLNEGNWLEVEPSDSGDMYAGAPVIGKTNPNTGKLTMLPTDEINDGDTRIIGFAMEPTLYGKTIRTVTAGVFASLVKGPASAGDNLVYDKASFALKKGEGPVTCLGDVAEGQTAMTTVRMGGGGGGSSVETVVLVSTTNIYTNGSKTIDGISVANNDLVLLTAQSTPSNRGVWKVNTAGNWSLVGQSKVVFVKNGTDHATSLWVIVSSDPITYCKENGNIDRTIMAVDVASTANLLSLVGIPPAGIDGVPTPAGTLVLTKNQNDPLLRKVYRVASGSWTALGQPKIVHVLKGVANGRTSWGLTGTDTYQSMGAFYL